MRNLNKQYRLSGDSLPEILTAWETEALRVRDDVKYRGKRTRGAHLLNALVLQWLRATPPRKRLAMLLAGMEELERIAAAERPTRVDVAEGPAARGDAVA